uniref:Cadherin domain-containing protein n=1 Tax=Plectus sambesii TaxID=2011161 RepID=A0A914VUP1_9BILA
TAGISEISQLQFWRSSDENADIDGQSYRRHRVIFRYPDSTGRSTTVYGRTILPFDVASDFKPVRIIQMVANGSSAEREINLYNFWVTNDADGTALHILDTDLSLPPQEATVTYEFLFGDPGTLGANFGGPRFGTNTYQFDMTIRTPVRTSVGSLTATSSEGSKIMYKLYGGNGYFAIRPETGEIMLERSLPLNASRYCLTVAGVDEQGRKQLAPVTIRLQDLPQNVNDPQCNVLPNVELLPAYIHVDDDDAAGNATTRRSSATNTFTSVTRASSASTPTTSTPFSVNTVTTRNRTSQSGSITDNSITTALLFPSPSSLAPSGISSTPSGPTTRVALSSSANEITVATPSGSPSAAATSTVASIFTTSLTSLPTSRASTELSPALSSEGSTQSTNAILLTTLFATTESVVRNDLTTTTRNPDTGGQVDQPAGSSAPDITPPTAGLADRSLDEKKLMDMACKLKDTKPIWGIICDLSKTTQNNQK